MTSSAMQNDSIDLCYDVLMRRQCVCVLFFSALRLAQPAWANSSAQHPTPSVSDAAVAAQRAVLAEIQRAAPHALAQWGAPALAIAAVVDNQVIFIGGFGNRRQDDEAKVDEHTRFALASLTKTFTAALVLQQAEEGKLSLGVPVRSLRRDFSLRDPVASEQLTLIDVLSHRSGIDESADLLWMGTGYDRSEVLRRIAQVPQATPFRSRFAYSNVLYVLAGEQAAERAGMSWESLLTKRILVPAKMTDAAMGIASASLGNAARPHAMRDGKLTPIDPRNLDNIAPAAGLYSSAADLSRWLKLWTQGGSLDGEQILSTSVVEAMLTPHTIVGLAPWAKKLYPESHFLLHGLGWMLQDYRGKMLAWNTGGIDGYSCSIAVLQDQQKFGVAVLTNVPFTGLPEAMVFQLIDAWLSAPSKDWIQIRLKMSMESRARQARAEQIELGPKNSAAWSVPVEKLLGRYVSSLLGNAEISQHNGVLTLRIAKTLSGKLSPWQANRLRMQFDDPAIAPAPLTFKLGASGSIDQFVLGEYGTFVRETPSAQANPIKQ